MAKKTKKPDEKRTATIPSRTADIAIYCTFQQLLDPKGLVPHPDNNNDHTESQVEMMKAMILANGWRSNVVISEHSQKIVAGHLRVRAAIALGMDQVPVDLQYFKNRSAEFKHLTADNELAKLSEFNAEKFALTAKELELEMDPDEFQEFIFNASEFGLEEMPEIEKEDEDDDGDDNIPVVTNPLSKKGDVWRMKTHKLMCGDSTNAKNISALMGTEKATLVFTDPPYKMGTDGGGMFGEEDNSFKKKMESIRFICDFNPADFLASFPMVFAKNTMNAYVFCSKDLVRDYLNWSHEKGYSTNILFWKKPNAVPLGGSHRPDVEYLLLFRKSAKWNNGVEGVSYSRCLEFNRETSDLHPTMKPVGLITDQVKISSEPGDIVFEPFSGSGSTLIACEKTGRRCFAIELDETYCDVAVIRWMEYTGEEAFLESTGQTWSEVMTERKT